MDQEATASLRLTWTIRDIATSDRHLLRAQFSVTAHLPETNADRQLFKEAFPGPAAEEAELFQRYFQPALNQAAAQAVSTRTAQHWLSEDGRNELKRILQRAGDTAAFPCGLSLGAPAEITVDSPTLRQRQMEQVRQQQAHDAAEDQWKQAELAVEALRKFRAMRQSMPELSAGRLLEQLAPVDAGGMLETLLRGEGAMRPAAAWVVSGSELLRVELPATRERDSEAASPVCRSVLNFSEKEDSPLGPLRSVIRSQGDQETLLLGARNGVIQLNPAVPKDHQVYHDNHEPWQMGYSSAAILGGRLWACHGQAGLVAWALDGPDAPAMVLDAPALRQKLHGDADRAGHLTPLDDRRALFSLGSMLVQLDATSGDATPLPFTGDAPIVRIHEEGETVAVIHGDGRISRLDRDHLKIVDQTHPCGRILSAGTLPWLGSVRLLLATQEGPIFCVGWEDSVVSQYRGPYRGSPMVDGAIGWAGAVSPDRRRMAFWHSWQGRAPAMELAVTPLTRHRIADFIFC